MTKSIEKHETKNPDVLINKVFGRKSKCTPLSSWNGQVLSEIQNLHSIRK